MARKRSRRCLVTRRGGRDKKGEGPSASSLCRRAHHRQGHAALAPAVRRDLFRQAAAVLPHDVEQARDVLVLELELALAFRQLRHEGLHTGLLAVGGRQDRVCCCTLLKGAQLYLRLLQVRIATLQGALGDLQRRLLPVQLVLEAQHLLLRGLLAAALVRNLVVQFLPRSTLRSKLRFQLSNLVFREAALVPALAQRLDGPQGRGLFGLVALAPACLRGRDRLHRRCRDTGAVVCAVRKGDGVGLCGCMAVAAKLCAAALCGLGHLEAACPLAPRLSEEPVTKASDRGDLQRALRDPCRAAQFAQPC
mmetsp:Transcript_11322/g.34079  ORF Transcript_11322/g.34079 Transcript_11322/m.34079 type:complete len:307 (-) Transcript_11322:102-1022(-)